MNMLNPSTTRQLAPWLIPGLTVLMLILFVLSLGIGYAAFDLAGAMGDVLQGRQSLAALVFSELRFPRAFIGAMVGFTLGLSGAAMQGLLRNPLADPGVIGISGSAAFGAVVVFYWGLAGTFSLALPLGGIAGAMLAAMVLFRISGRGATTTTLILAGVAINSFAGALTALALNLAPNPFAAVEIMYWLMGSLADRSLHHVWLGTPLMLLGWLLILSRSRALDALSLGEDTARSLGVNIVGLRRVLVAGTALAVGSSVAVAGAVGFVGLVVPHLLRPFVANQPSRLLLVSGLGGASVTMAADMLIRLIMVRPELKLGVVTAIVGAPFLFSLIWKLRRNEL